MTDTEDEVDSDFDIDEGEEPSSEQEEDGPRRKFRVVTKAYKVGYYCHIPLDKFAILNYQLRQHRRQVESCIHVHSIGTKLAYRLHTEFQLLKCKNCLLSLVFWPGTDYQLVVNDDGMNEYDGEIIILGSSR